MSARGGQHRVRQSPVLMSRPMLLVMALLAVVVPLTTWLDLNYPGRPLLALLFLVILPGWPIVGLLRVPDRLVRTCLTIAISLSAQLLLSTAMLVTGLFSAGSVLVGTSAISLLAIAACWRRAASAGSVSQDLRGSVGEIGRVARDGVVPGVGLVAVFGLWYIGQRAADPAEMSGYGLISLMNPYLLAALVLLTLMAVVELRRSHLRQFWLAFIAVAFVLVLQGASSAIENVATFPVGWLHMGFADYITTNGSALTSFDARFSWPGFFALLSVITTSTGLTDGAELLRWAPPVGDMLFLLPLMLLARTLSTSKRAMWLTPLLFAAGNWFQQDYLSPQQWAWFLALTVVAVLVWSARAAAQPVLAESSGLQVPAYLRRPIAMAARIDGLDGPGYVRLLAGILLLLAAIVVTHQLTPVMLAIMLLVLAYTRRTRFPTLWIVLGVMTTLWVAFGATAFWVSHLGEIFGGVGSLGSNLSSGVAERVSGTPEHLQMQSLRIAFCGVYLVLALAGLYKIRRGGTGLLLGGLAFGPFLLVALQSYGGEVMLRCFVFALPALSILAAEVLAPMVRSGRRRYGLLGAGTAWIVLMLLCLAQLGSRGANAPFERVTAGQLAAVQIIEQSMMPGASISTFNSFTPLGVLPTGEFRISKINAEKCGNAVPTMKCVLSLRPDVLYVSSSTDAYNHLIEGRAADFGTAIAAELAATDSYEVLFQEKDVTVLINTAAKRNTAVAGTTG